MLYSPLVILLIIFLVYKDTETNSRYACLSTRHIKGCLKPAGFLRGYDLFSFHTRKRIRFLMGKT